MIFNGKRPRLCFEKVFCSPAAAFHDRNPVEPHLQMKTCSSLMVGEGGTLVQVCSRNVLVLQAAGQNRPAQTLKQMQLASIVWRNTKNPSRNYELEKTKTEKPKKTEHHRASVARSNICTFCYWSKYKAHKSVPEQKKKRSALSAVQPVLFLQQEVPELDPPPHPNTHLQRPLSGRAESSWETGRR